MLAIIIGFICYVAFLALAKICDQGLESTDGWQVSLPEALRAARFSLFWLVLSTASLAYLVFGTTAIPQGRDMILTKVVVFGGLTAWGSFICWNSVSTLWKTWRTRRRIKALTSPDDDLPRAA